MKEVKNTQILKIPDVAQLFNVSEDTVRRWIDKKQIPCQKIGGQWFFNLEVINKYFEEVGTNMKGGDDNE